MTDIVERLRALQHFDVCYPVPHPTCEEAAAEIERLRAALRPFACECVGFCKDAKHNYGEIEPIDTCKYGRNRAALGEERT